MVVRSRYPRNSGTFRPSIYPRSRIPWTKASRYASFCGVPDLTKAIIGVAESSSDGAPWKTSSEISIVGTLKGKTYRLENIATGGSPAFVYHFEIDTFSRRETTI